MVSDLTSILLCGVAIVLLAKMEPNESFTAGRRKLGIIFATIGLIASVIYCLLKVARPLGP